MLYLFVLILSRFKEKTECFCFRDQEAASLSSPNRMCYYRCVTTGRDFFCMEHSFRNKINRTTCVSISSNSFSVCKFCFCLIPSYFSSAPIFQVVTNCKNTVQGFKRFHGRAFSDPYVQRLKNSTIYDVVQMPTGTAGIKVRDHWEWSW